MAPTLSNLESGRHRATVEDKRGAECKAKMQEASLRKAFLTMTRTYFVTIRSQDSRLGGLEPSTTYAQTITSSKA